MAHPRTAVTQQFGRLRVALLALLALAFLFSLLSVTPPAHAATSSATSAEDCAAADFPYRISGNVQNKGEPLEGVELKIEGNGVDCTVATADTGQWRVNVPERNATYKVTLDEETLPEGVIVAEEGSDTPNVKEVEVGPGGRVAVNFFIGQGERVTTSFFDQLIERIVNGLSFGLMLALAAIGLSLVYGTTGISNFAHAEMVTFGAIATLFFSQTVGWSIWLAIPLAIVASAGLGLGLDVVLWRPLRHRRVGVVQLMIVSIGLSLALRYLFQYFIGGSTQQLVGSTSTPIPLFGAVSLTLINIISIIVSIVAILAFAWWLLRTRIGKATRAISDNSSLAAASGIDVDRVVRIVWIMAGGMAGLAGVLFAYFRPGIKWDMGAEILLLIFAAVTLGGLGTAFGALVGSLVVGMLVEVSTLFGMPTDLKYVSALVVLIIILLFRPQGILGRRERIG